MTFFLLCGLTDREEGKEKRKYWCKYKNCKEDLLYYLITCKYNLLTDALSQQDENSTATLKTLVGQLLQSHKRRLQDMYSEE